MTTPAIYPQPEPNAFPASKILNKTQNYLATITEPLQFTELENLEIGYKLIQKGENDWYGFSVKNKIFDAAGDPEKLEIILEKFREIAEKYYSWSSRI